MARTATPLAERLVLTVPQVAVLCGCAHSRLYKHLIEEPESGSMKGTITLPGGASVPVHKSPHGYWVCYRAQLDEAIAQHGHEQAS